MARACGECDVTDADIEKPYQEMISGRSGAPLKGTVNAELIVKHFHGPWDDKDMCTRCSVQ